MLVTLSPVILASALAAALGAGQDLTTPARSVRAQNQARAQLGLLPRKAPPVAVARPRSRGAAAFLREANPERFVAGGAQAPAASASASPVVLLAMAEPMPALDEHAEPLPEPGAQPSATDPALGAGEAVPDVPPAEPSVPDEDRGAAPPPAGEAGEPELQPSGGTPPPDDTPAQVLRSERAEDGTVVEVVAGAGGLLEVHRDPVGRRESAGPVQLPPPEGSVAPPLAAGTLSRERAVDAQGWLVERVRDGAGRVLHERLLGHVVQLAVQSTRRAADGGIVQVVRDADGAIEVRRDPVGRFLSAAPAGVAR